MSTGNLILNLLWSVFRMVWIVVFCAVVAVLLSILAMCAVLSGAATFIDAGDHAREEFSRFVDALK